MPFHEVVFGSGSDRVHCRSKECQGHWYLRQYGQSMVNCGVALLQFFPIFSWHFCKKCNVLKFFNTKCNMLTFDYRTVPMSTSQALTPALCPTLAFSLALCICEGAMFYQLLPRAISKKRRCRCQFSEMCTSPCIPLDPTELNLRKAF